MKLLRNFILFLLFTGLSSSQAQSIPSWKITDVKKLMNTSDSVLVISFWATFCKPCIEEIPYLQRISNKYKEEKVKLLLVSLDLAAFYPNRIEAFAQKHNFNSQIVWLNETNADHFCPIIDESWSGVIPATLIINNRTGYRKFVEEQMKPEEFEMELKKQLVKNSEIIKGTIKRINIYPFYILLMFNPSSIQYLSIQNPFYFLLIEQPILRLSFTEISFPFNNSLIASLRCFLETPSSSLGLSSIAP